MTKFILFILMGLSWLHGLTTGAAQVYGAEPGLVIKSFGKKSDGSPEYYVATYHSRQYSYPARYTPEYANEVVLRAYRWTINGVFRVLYPQLDPAVFDRMLAHDLPTDGRSNMVIVSRSSEFKDSDFLATMRFSYTNEENPDLPLETALGWKYDRPEIKYGGYPVFAPGYFNLSEDVFWGDVIEIKNLAKAPGITEDFIPLLYYVANHSRMSESNRGVQIPIPDALRQFVDPDENLIYGLKPSHYLLYCDLAMQGYYEQMGFRRITEKPFNNRLIVMEMTREEYAKLGSKVLDSRAGYSLVNKVVASPAHSRAALSRLRLHGACDIAFTDK